MELGRLVSSLPGSILSAVCWDFRRLVDVLMRPTRRPSVSAATAAAAAAPKKDSAVWFCFLDSKQLKRLCSASPSAVQDKLSHFFQEINVVGGGAGDIKVNGLKKKKTQKSWCYFQPTKFHVSMKSTSCSFQAKGNTVCHDFILFLNLFITCISIFFHLTFYCEKSLVNKERTQLSL